MPAFMSRRFTGTLRGADAGCLYGLNAQNDPWRASSLAWRTGGDDKGLVGAAAAQCDIDCRGHAYGSCPEYLNAGRRMCRVMCGMLDGPSKKLLSCRAINSTPAIHVAPSGSF